MLKKITNVLVLMVIAVLFYSCEKSSTTNNRTSIEKVEFNGVLLGKLETEKASLVVSNNYLQKEIRRNHHTTFGKYFRIISSEIVKVDDLYFLKIMGSNFENCRIPLELRDGLLFEGNHRTCPVVICIGTGVDGCEPKLDGKHWYCSKGSEECIKISMASDHGIFSNINE